MASQHCSPQPFQEGLLHPSSGMWGSSLSLPSNNEIVSLSLSFDIILYHLVNKSRTRQLTSFLFCSITLFDIYKIFYSVISYLIPSNVIQYFCSVIPCLLTCWISLMYFILFTYCKCICQYYMVFCGHQTIYFVRFLTQSTCSLGQIIFLWDKKILERTYIGTIYTIQSIGTYKNLYSEFIYSWIML